MAKSKKIDKDMGFRLKKARLDQKLTYDELSEMSGVSSRYIKEIENHGNIPSLEKLGQLIRALHRLLKTPVLTFIRARHSLWSVSLVPARPPSAVRLSASTPALQVRSSIRVSASPVRPARAWTGK